MAQPGAPQVPAGPVAEAGPGEERHQDEELGGDPEGRAQAQQQHLRPAERRPVGGAPQAEVEAEDGDRDDVVGDRRPHVGDVDLPGVEHLADEHRGAVEEDLRQAQVGQRDHVAPVRRHRRLAPALRRVERHDPRRGDGDQCRRHTQRGEERRHDPVGVGRAAVLVLVHRPDDLRHQDRVHHAAGEQDVEAVGDGVGEVERLGRTGAVAEDDRDQGGPDEPEDPGGEGAPGHQNGRGHHRTGPAHRGLRSARTCLIRNTVVPITTSPDTIISIHPTLPACVACTSMSTGTPMAVPSGVVSRATTV
ncbi:hypothetical protein SDC9_102590 [bioreactor metagenome]|uniref:Uncharacterized protein n=1 Tax=bioreactor metagenome TaxID=1076179 RepID=A0A645AY48_9ZZZZ